MDELIKLVTDKTGITPEQAKSAIETIGDYAKEKLPPGIGDQVTNFLEGKEIGGIGDMLKNSFGL